MIALRLALALYSLTAGAADFRTPAGRLPARATPGDIILPGGRRVTPLGEHYFTGPGPFGLAISPSGNTLVSADGGPNRYSLTVLRRSADGRWTSSQLRAKRRDEKLEAGDDDDWRSVFLGLAFADDNILYASEGESGRIRVVDLRTGKRVRAYDLNQGGFADSYSADIAFDPARRLLFVVDQANFRVAVFDTQTHRLRANVKVGRLPFAMAYDAQRRRLYVTHVGMFEYRILDGADRRREETGLDFPAFGFPSEEARQGVKRRAADGRAVDVPGLGDPNVREANSLAVIDVADPARPRVLHMIPTGAPFGQGIQGGSSPSGVALGWGQVFVSNATNDTVSVIDPEKGVKLREVALRIPGLESLRGVMPVGIHADQSSGLLYVAEAGINAIAVIDARAGTVLGHLPAAWMPARVIVRAGTLYTVNAKGFGTGPNAGRDRSFQGEMRRGAITLAPAPARSSLARHTATVLENNGFVPSSEAPEPLPAALRHVVLIIKENRTFDEVMGDMQGVVGEASLARFGPKVAPNHRAIAEQWALSDNFYANSEVSADGHHWLGGAYPNAWTETSVMASYGGAKSFRLPTTAPGRLSYAGSNSSIHPEELIEPGTLWHHLEKHGISFRNFGAGFELAGGTEGPGLKPTGIRMFTNMPMADPLYRNTSRKYPNYNTNIPDQYRATQLITELKGMSELPRLLYIHLPNDHLAKARPEDGYPVEASFMADNDYALGRILEYLSSRPEWRSMAVFITEDDPQGGVDHVDSHRTVLLMAGPYIRKGCIARQNTDFNGMFKTIFRILGIPQLHLYTAAARDLAECFTSTPDLSPYRVRPVDPSIFVPEHARDPKDPKPQPAMDDPRELQRQHRERVK